MSMTAKMQLLFQSTLPRGERLICGAGNFPVKKFQSTLPRGERRKLAEYYNDYYSFNPHSHEGSDIAKIFLVCIFIFCFNPHSHEGSDYSPNFHHAEQSVFQSTLPRGERRKYVFHSDFLCIVSIHTPTRGATIICSHRFSFLGVSIHTPTRGATNLQRTSKTT